MLSEWGLLNHLTFLCITYIDNKDLIETTLSCANNYNSNVRDVCVFQGSEHYICKVITKSVCSCQIEVRQMKFSALFCL